VQLDLKASLLHSCSRDTSTTQLIVDKIFSSTFLHDTLTDPKIKYSIDNRNQYFLTVIYLLGLHLKIS